MPQGIYNYPNAIRGDTIVTKRFTLITASGPVDLTNVAIKCDFVGKRNGVTVKKDSDFAGGNGGITVVDAANGIIEIDAFSMDTAGKYEYDIEFTFPDSTVKTYVKGCLFVADDVTKEAS